jgi:2-iminobutanoate/2-iminopropanoate deaminase
VLIFVTDMKQGHEVWRARRQFYTGDFPASTMVEVRSLASPELLIAAEAIAVLGAGKA